MAAGLPTCACAVVLSLALTSDCYSADQLPPPSVFLTAQTMAILNDTDQPTLADRAYDELTKWGRYKIVESPDSADLVLLITTSVNVVGLRREQDSLVKVFGSGNSSVSGTASTVETVSEEAVGFTTLAFIDMNTGRKVWGESREWGMFRSATRGIIKDLRKRVERAEKTKAK